MGKPRLRHMSVVFRHGDRSPQFNAMEPLSREAAYEAAAWAVALPTSKLAMQMSTSVPVISPHARTRDASLGPTFGALTGLGVLQMRKLGSVVAEVCRPHGGAVVKKALASNFRRTQFSAQCLISGLNQHLQVHGLEPSKGVPVTVAPSTEDVLNIWGTDPNLRRLAGSNGLFDVIPITEEEKQAKDVIFKSVPSFEFLVRPFSWLNALDHTMCREGKMGGGGIMRGRDISLRIEDLFNEMDVDRAGKLTRAHVQRAFNHVLHSPFTSAKDLDEFMRRLDANGDDLIDSHEMRRFMSDLRLPVAGNNVTQASFEAASVSVEKAVSRRFDAMLSKRVIRRLAAGQIATMLTQDLQRAQTFPDEEKVTLKLYASHDVTLVPLMRELGLWSGKDAWPGVASALIFSLWGEGVDGLAHPRVQVSSWNGARGTSSGLEPRVMELATRKVNFKVGGGESHHDEEFTDLGAVLAWSKALVA